MSLNQIMNKTNYTVEIVNWESAKQQIKPIRETVFIQEQHVPVELEWDEMDSESIHILSRLDDNTPVGTARMLSNGHIGRMSVLSKYRNQGIGSAMLNALLVYAKQHQINDLFLFAQTNAVDFYKQHEFTTVGKVFMDAGIPHLKMIYDKEPLIHSGQGHRCPT